MPVFFALLRVVSTQSHRGSAAGSQVGVPYSREWRCVDEKVLALRYVNRSASVVVREEIAFRLGGMRIVGAAIAPQEEEAGKARGFAVGAAGGAPPTTVSVVVEPGEEAMLLVHGAVLGVSLAHAYDRATTLEFLETTA